MKHPRGRPAHPDILTPAEWRISEAVRHGLSNPEIAARQGVSVDAVKFHVSNILQKLGFLSRQELRMWTGIRSESDLKSGSPPSGEYALSSIGQVARYTTDIGKATDWFKHSLGLSHLYSFDDVSFFDCGGVRLFLCVGDPTKNSILYFSVQDIQSAHDHLKSTHNEIVSAPHLIHQHPDGTEEWMAFINDCDGQPLGLMSKVRPRHSKTK